jgi:CBS domain-containing protein
MVWSGAGDADATQYMHRLAGDVVDELAAMGWRPDPHGVTATGFMSASSIDEWRTAIADWLAPPCSEEELIAISIVLDARLIYGSERGLDVPALIREAHPRPALVRLLLRQALACKPPTGFLRDIVVEHSGEHAGHFDIKRGGLLPIVNVARYAAFAAGASTTETIERLRTAAEAGTLDVSDAATLEEAFELFSELRLEHQIRQLRDEVPLDNLLDPKRLYPLTRRHLRDAFRGVASVQRKLSTQLSWGT